MLPGNGWVVIAFFTNNPGAWLMHCHIAWHVSQGLGVQFLERGSEIEARMDLKTTNDNCMVWDKWFADKWLADTALLKTRENRAKMAKITEAPLRVHRQPPLLTI